MEGAVPAVSCCALCLRRGTPVESDHVVPLPTGRGGQVLRRRGVLARPSRRSWGGRARGLSWLCAAGLTWSRWALEGELGVPQFTDGPGVRRAVWSPAHPAV